MIRLFIILVLFAIIASLASGLYYLFKDSSDSRRTLRALTWRIGLSVALFVLLMLAHFFGLIEPTGGPYRG
jgi:hypothetical protein